MTAAGTQAKRRSALEWKAAEHIKAYLKAWHALHVLTRALCLPCVEWIGTERDCLSIDKRSENIEIEQAFPHSSGEASPRNIRNRRSSSVLSVNVNAQTPC